MVFIGKSTSICCMMLDHLFKYIPKSTVGRFFFGFLSTADPNPGRGQWSIAFESRIGAAVSARSAGLSAAGWR